MWGDLKMAKTFVEVIVKYKSDGKLYPLTILWEDGRKFDIDKIIDIRKATSIKNGGKGIRYTCSIQNKQIYLFLDEDRWFIG
jgi:hypothetical protein